MSSCCTEPDDCETACDTTSIPDSCIHNRYDNNELDEEVQTSEYVALGRMSFIEWERCEKKRLDMLNEAKEKATQMEKTMKWWVECTSLWRTNWSIVRSERDAARNTIDKLMSNLHLVQEDTLKLFEAKLEADREVKLLRAQVEELTKRLGDVFVTNTGKEIYNV